MGPRLHDFEDKGKKTTKTNSTPSTKVGFHGFLKLRQPSNMSDVGKYMTTIFVRVFVFEMVSGIT